MRSDTQIAFPIAQERRPASQIGSELDYVHITHGVRVLLIGVIALVLTLLALALVVQVDEVAHTRGEFTPVQRVQVIQTAQGGAVQDILVRNGAPVEKGQLIAKFRAAELLRDIERTALRIAYLRIQIDRLDAFASRRPPALAEFEEKYPALVKEALSLHKGQVRQLESSLIQIDRQIEEEKTAIASAKKEIPSAKASMDASRELLERVREGAAKGIVARNRVAQVEEQSAQTQRMHTQLVTSLDQHASRIKRLDAERDAIVAKTAAEARNKRADLMAELSELKATQAAYESRSHDIEVRAPIAGIIQKLSDTPIGTVIPPGGTVCEIVPTEGGVLMQVRVSPRDIGFVKVGQKVIVKSDAFDYSRFGSIPGKVVRIAPSNTQDSPGERPYILVEIELERPYVGVDKNHIVTAGMTGEATILTGEKTILQYLLKPIYLTLDTALHER